MKPLFLIMIILLLAMVGLEVAYFSQVASYPYQLNKLVDRPVTIPTNEMVIEVPEYFVHDVDELAGIKNRPLFIKDRKPPSAEEIKKNNILKKRSKFPKIALTGIIIIDNKKRALFKNLRTKKSFSLYVNDSYENWSLRNITDKSVLFTLAKEQEILKLRHFKHSLKRILKRPLITHTQQRKPPNLSNIFRSKNPATNIVRPRPLASGRKLGTPKRRPPSNIGSGFGPAL